MTGATPASPKHLAWRLQRRRSVPPRPRSDRASRRAQIDHKGTRVVAQADESIRSIHRDVGKQYFVKISLSASLVRSMSPRSMMEFLVSFSIFSSPSKVCSTIVLSPSNDILRLCSSITTEAGFISFMLYTHELPGVSTDM